MKKYYFNLENGCQIPCCSSWFQEWFLQDAADRISYFFHSEIQNTTTSWFYMKQYKIGLDGSMKYWPWCEINWLLHANNKEWVKDFRIIPEIRILRLTFCGNSASKCWIREIIIAYLIYFQSVQWERSGSVVECLTRDRRSTGLSLTGVTALWSLSKTHLSKPSTGSTQEELKDCWWDVKNQIKQISLSKDNRAFKLEIMNI